jgi:hypothetical protein
VGFISRFVVGKIHVGRILWGQMQTVSKMVVTATISIIGY